MGTFSPSMSLRFFKQGSEGRVRAATEQENFGVDDQNPHMAGALVKAAIILQSGILAFFIVTMSTGDGKAPGEMDAERMLAYHPAGTFDEVGDALGDGTLQVYVAVALLPYMRMLCYVVLLSSTTKSFGLQEIVSMSILLLSQIFRAASDDEHRGRMNLINPLYIKIVLIFVDLTLCFCCGCLKTRINKLNFNDKEIFVYKLLPTCLVAMIVPCAYLTSESASCWVPNNHGDWNDTTETCHNIFVSNNALSYAFVGSGFLYLVMTPFLTKHYSLRNLVSFNFPFFRTYIQIIFFLCATISALFMFSTAREIAADTFAPGTKEENIKFYFDTKFPLFYNDYNFQLFYQCTRDDGTYFMSDYISLSCDYDLRLDMTALNPTGHYYWATRKCLLVNSCMNMCCLVFLGLLVLSRPSAKFHLFADGIAITYILFSHACLFYNCNIVINEDKRFAHDISTDSRGIPAFEFFGGNFAVVVNIVMGVTFFSLFNFSFPDLELEDFLKVSDKIQNFDVVFRFILMGILQFVAMIIFGFRPRDAGDQKEMNNSITDQSRMQNYALDIFTPVLPCVWSLLFIVYFFKLGHDEHVEKVIGEEDDDVEEGSIENGEDALFTMWTVVLRYSGDLLIPVSLLYFSVHFMSDLSHPEVRLRTTIPLTGIALLFMVDTATFFEQPEEYKQKSAYTEDKGGSTWFGKQLIVCVSVVLLLLLIVVRKKSCLQLSEEKRRKHLFDNVACIALSTFSTLTYLISEYFSCATRLINKELYKLKHDEETELTDMTRGDIVKLFIDKNQCEAISYNLTPLVLMMVFTAIGKIIYPEASEDFPLKRIMTLNLPRFRIFQLVVGTIMAMTAIVMFGLRHESRIDPWVETFTTVYFVLTLFMFIVEGFYSTLFAKIRAGGNEEFDVNFDKNGGPSLRINRSSLQMRNLVGSEKSIWNGGTKGRHKGLEKDRTKTGLSTTSHSDNELKMGAGVLGENSLAPGML
ncbi:hypothetical protein TL16_g01407 [Triparma laevis f. inornata]|uniref:Uncharacterized protein n=1 Tax=Triparma laevis f. inornata TaxID=1714386 RepID=A0A9W7DT22_9STRA|nr:hypothetical protein TL16_g01407 [Triparma laevis f. inornata]